MFKTENIYTKSHMTDFYDVIFVDIKDKTFEIEECLSIEDVKSLQAYYVSAEIFDAIIKGLIEKDYIIK